MMRREALLSHISVLLAICAGSHLTHDLNNVWSNRALHSPLAKEIQEHQSKCTSPVYRNKRREYGMGSEVHVWSQALCNSMEKGKTLVQVNEEWPYNDPAMCSPTLTMEPFSCYFNLVSNCPSSPQDVEVDIENDFDRCPKYIHDIPTRTAFRAAAMEYLFSNLNPELVDKARKAIVDVFGQEGIPEDLITVHIRWGDKKIEMELVSPTEYVEAINGFVDKHSIAKPRIFVSTEHHHAIPKLQAEIASQGKSWEVHHFAPLVASHTTVQANRGPSGKNSLIALLLAMEAKYYVLTTGSNWSRLMNELRTNVIDVACGNCTHMVDLRQAHTKYQD